MRSKAIWIAVAIGLVAAIAMAAQWEERSNQAMGGAALDDDATANVVALGTSSTQFTLPGTSKDPYILCAIGNTAYILCGSNPTVTTSVGGFAFAVPEGVCIGPVRLTGPKCAYIAPTATGFLQFLHLNPALN